MRKGNGLFVAVACCALAACGGGSGSGGTPPPSPAPSPSPTPSPTPTPGPSPTPAPTPAPTPGPKPGGTPNLASATDGSTLRLQRACTPAAIIFTAGRVSGLQSIAQATLSTTAMVYTAAAPARLSYEGEDHFLTGENAEFLFYEGVSKLPLAIINTATFSAPGVTFGYGSKGGLCFYAGGLAATVPTGTVVYDGTVDGLAQSAAGTQRLIKSSADVTVSFAAGTGTLALTLKGYPDPFAITAGQTQTTIGTLTANLTLSGTQVTVTNLAGPAGYTGTMQGELVGTAGMALAFQLRNGAGDVIWGAVAVDGSPGRAAWNY